MDLVALADFNAVALHGGFSQASRVTGRPKATLSRRVRQLEDALGVRLFERDARLLRLTDEGRELKEQTHSLLERIDEVAEQLGRQTRPPRGRLRVSVPVLLAQRGLGRVAAAYARAYPEVTLEIVADDRFVDPLIEDFDLVLRANPDPSTGLVGRCYLRDDLVVAAHPHLHPPTRGASAPSIVLSGATAPRWHLEVGKRRRTIETHIVLRLSSMAMVHDAALAGAGAAAMPLSLIQPDLDAERLVSWGRLADRRIEAWALHPSHRHISARAQAFVQCLVDLFAEGAGKGFARVAALDALTGIGLISAASVESAGSVPRLAHRGV